jgi:hypothetical protein
MLSSGWIGIQVALRPRNGVRSVGRARSNPRAKCESDDLYHPDGVRDAASDLAVSQLQLAADLL